MNPIKKLATLVKNLPSKPFELQVNFKKVQENSNVDGMKFAGYHGCSNGKAEAFIKGGDILQKFGENGH